MDKAINILPGYTPNYVIDEVQYYFDKINAKKNDCFTLDNAILLVNLARMNNRINEEQAQNIKKTINKIKES